MESARPNHQGNNLNKPVGTCLFLIILAYFLAGLLTLLNLYIAYNIVFYLTGDGFSFMGALFLGSTYIVTIPINVLSFLFAPKIRTSDKGLIGFYLPGGIIITLAGFILHNATGLWIFIAGFGIVLIIGSIICHNQKRKIFDCRKKL